MTQHDDKDIKKIIQENVKKPEIKLTSAQIIAKFNERQVSKKSKKPFFSTFQFKLGLSFVSLALIIGATLFVTRGLFTPPITTSEPPLEEKQGMKVPGGKEGEFIFMSTSSLLYAPLNDGVFNSLSPRYAKSNIPANTSELEATLDQTLPLVEDFYSLDRGFNFVKNEGNYIGVHESYTREYIINENVRVLANVELEVEDHETETEIKGEIIIDDTVSYMFEGETEVDTKDQETDISLKIFYSENSYLEVESENERGTEQNFTYKLVENGIETYYLEIENYDIKGKNSRYIDAFVKRNNIDYNFKIAKRQGKIVVEYQTYFIEVTIINKREYNYEYKNK